VQRVLPSALKPSVARPLRTRLRALSAAGTCSPCAAAAFAADRQRWPSATSPRPHPHRDHSCPPPSRCPRLPSATQGSGQHQHRSHTRTATATLRRCLPRPPQRRPHRHSPGLPSASSLIDIGARGRNAAPTGRRGENSGQGALQACERDTESVSDSENPSHAGPSSLACLFVAGHRGGVPAVRVPARRTDALAHSMQKAGHAQPSRAYGQPRYLTAARRYAGQSPWPLRGS
jgi:hypothetical protein